MEIKKKIHASECDYNLKITLFSLCNIVQNMVTEALGMMGLDNIVLREKYNAMWVFTKNQLKCFKRPSWDEEVIIQTKLIKANRLLVYFLTEIIDMNGNVMVSDVLELCVIDRVLFKFKRLSDIGISMMGTNISINYDIESSNYEKVDDVVITPMMIDYSMHMNNSQSILCFLNHLSIAEIENIYNCSFVFTIKYSSQARLQDKVSLSMARSNALLGYRMDQLDGTNIVTAQLKKL